MLKQKHSDFTKKFSVIDIIKMHVFLIDKIFAMFSWRVVQHTVGIHMGIPCMKPVLSEYRRKLGIMMISRKHICYRSDIGEILTHLTFDKTKDIVTERKIFHRFLQRLFFSFIF